MDTQKAALLHQRNAELEKELAVKNRELEIEAALEKVRSRALSMYNSNELREVVAVVFQHLKELGFALERGAAIVLIFSEGSMDHVQWIADNYHSYPLAFKIPYSDDAMVADIFKEREKATGFFSKIYSFGEKNKYFKFLFELPDHKHVPEDVKRMLLEIEDYGFSIAFEKNSAILIATNTGKLVSADEKEILKRVAKVFEQSYIRFLDLQKAETQAREARIEVALERVRSRTMEMHHSNELPEISSLLFQQVEELGVTAIQNSIAIVNEKAGFVELSTTIHGSHLLRTLNVPIDEQYLMAKAVTAWKATYKSLTLEFEGQELKSYNEFRNSFLEKKVNFPEDHWIVNISFFSKGWLSFSSDKSISEEINVVLIRFAAIFEQTYTRFLDLQKAEAQARDAQIEVALERVRSRTMAMQHSADLTDAANLLFQQVQALGVPSWSCGFNIWDEKEKCFTAWMSSEGILQPPFKIPLSEVSTFNRFYESRQKREVFYVEEMSGDALVAQYEYMQGLPGFGEILNDFLKSGFTLPIFQINHVVNFKQGNLIFITSVPVPEAIEIFKRFAIVFEQTYTRFLDLQKAEAQTREGQIQLALERVRARAMAMRNSDELNEVIGTVFTECTRLDMILNRSIIMIYDPQTNDSRWWMANPEVPEVPMSFLVKYHEHTPYLAYLDAWKERVFKWEYLLHGSVKKNWDDFIFLETELSLLPGPVIAGMRSMEAIHLNASFNNFGSLTLATAEPLSTEHFDILLRFAKVFDLTYTRFNDLQKAEAQAREGQIEASLERVRSKTMAMHSSHDVGDTIATLFDEFIKLNIETFRCGIGIVHQNKRMEVWTAKRDTNGNVKFFTGYMDMDMHPMLTGAYSGWEQKQETYLYDLKGDDLKEYFTRINNNPNYPLKYDIPSLPYRLIFSVFYFPEGFVFAFTQEELSAEAMKIFKRFSGVFGQTYRRYRDLQKAEAQAKEAQIEAALEKVRSRTLAMQKSGEMAETVTVLFQQLIVLGIEPNRLYIAIVKDEKGASEFWITDEDGTKISTAFSADMNANVSFAKMFEGWKLQRKSLVIEMQGDELQHYFQHLTSLGVPFKGGLSHKRRVQDIAYFSKGFIGIASPDRQPPETLQLLERFAAVFNLTFTRFNDLKIAEAHAIQAEHDLIAIKEAKQKAEAAFTELQATQKQLIQSEKMASLGELTAGIAHEIQNPLNFVNNFSEVSKELLDEMNEELLRGNYEDANAIAVDIKQNLEKINHHGKRADAIVKSMLQHSGSSKGIKEPTDINKLADEYLRLSYHGLRGKDKDFNAEMQTNYDESIGKINIVPQDIGRVLLNLYNNAFYATNERKKNAGEDYKPLVSIETKKINDKVEIKVSDNGFGITQNIADKIFQPFFTTKPTGQGTGLGLSLSYDIIKAHGGEISVNTKGKEGAEFLIQLPQNNNN